MNRMGWACAFAALLLALLSPTVASALLPVPILLLGLAGIAAATWIAAAMRQGRPSGKGKAVLAIQALVGVAAIWSIVTLANQPRAETVEFKSGDTTLIGEVYLPRDGCPCPAVVFVHGSGEGTAGQFAYYARQLADRGIVAMAYDKRGSGRSGGSLYDGGYDLYAANVADAVKTVRQRADVLPRQVALVAYSEGEWVAPMAAGLTDVSAIAVIGASGLSPVGQSDEQAVLRMRNAGYSEADVAAMLALSKETRAYERSGQGRDALMRRIDGLHRSPWYDLAGNLPHPEELAAWEDYAWWRSYMDTDPGLVWAGVRVPTLFLKGEKDDHSYADQTVKRLRTIKPDAQVRIVPGADHSLIRHPLGGHWPPALFAPYFDDVAELVKSGNGAPPTPNAIAAGLTRR